MSDESIVERMEDAAHCLFLAKQRSDYWDTWNATIYRRAIQVKVGKELRAQYELPQELPHRILALLRKLDGNAVEVQS